VNGEFERDTYPGRPKILFVGSPYSTHTHAWIDLLSDAKLNVRLFSVGNGYPPHDWKVRTYLTAVDLPAGLDQSTRLCLFPTPEEYKHYGSRGGQAFRIVKLTGRSLLRSFSSTFRKELKTQIRRVGLISSAAKAPSQERWLAQIIREWQPDIIHTLGLDPAALFYFSVRQDFKLKGIGTWVLQLRGGSDLSLSHLDPQAVERIAPVLQACDQIVSDNRVNFQFARAMGIKEEQISAISPVPGTGGLDLESLRLRWDGPPSARERIIVWPKTYECPWSKALPVFEALKLAWNSIKPCTIYMLTVNPEAKMWFFTLADEIRKNCQTFTGIPREEVISLMTRSRVMLATSLVDGVPNSLYEAMACGSFPIVSPLDTITPIVENGENVLYARNLYPEEIADSLVRAMTDDRLVDDAAKLNVELVTKLANRREIERRVVDYYEKLASNSRGRPQG
jgi:glycosyltransferase involved in cell wall biosynthesis